MAIVQYDESNPINFNLVKEAIADALVTEKYISAEQGDFFKKNYAVTLVKKNWFGRLIDSLLWSKESKDDYKLVVVKVIYPNT